MRRGPPPLRTYSHLGARPEVPSEYQIVSSRLLYHPQRGFEIDVPVASWYQRHQGGGQLRCRDWEAFVDPRETTYASYTRLQAGNEQHLDAVARSIQLTGQLTGQAGDRLAPGPWRETVLAVIPPLRHVWHGFQMIAAYFGHMAPSGRLTLVALFQAGDELRRIHRVAMSMGQWHQIQQRATPSTPSLEAWAARALDDWQALPAWQPLRRAVEEALCAYDWGESFAALCLGIKPFVDQLILDQLGEEARRANDFHLGEVLASFAEDARWHRAWAAAFVTLLLREDEQSGSSNRATLVAWLARWVPAGRAAARGVAGLLGAEGEALVARSEAHVADWLKTLGLDVP